MIWLWLVLGMIGLFSARSMLPTLALALMGYIQLQMIFHAPQIADVGQVLVELMTACVIWMLTEKERPLWARVMTWLFVASLTAQATAGYLEALGVSMATPLYHACNTIYTAQFACVASAGGESLVRILRTACVGRTGGSNPDHHRVATHYAAE